MPYFSRRILVSLCPLVNLDLFKKGYYHVSVQLVDQNAEQNLARVTCLEVKDLFGPQLTNFSYPGACCINGKRFITQTSLIEYSEQSVLLGECFMFQSDCPIKGDHMDAYLPSHLKLQLDLMFSGEEELPTNPSSFSSVSTRTLEFCVDWRKGLHDHFPVMFDYFHMAAVGVTLHASLTELALQDYLPDSRHVAIRRSPSLRSTGAGRRWTSSQFRSSVPQLPSLHSILFGNQENSDLLSHGPRAVRSLSLPVEISNGGSVVSGGGGGVGRNVGRKTAYQTIMEQQIERAQDSHYMLCDVLRSARDSLHIGHAIMSKEITEVKPCPEITPITEAASLLEAEELCIRLISQLNASLSASWEWFCSSSIMQPEMIGYLAAHTHHVRMKYTSETLISIEHPSLKNRASIAEPTAQTVVAPKIRKNLAVPMALFCKENVETCLNSSVIFIEPTPWSVLQEGQLSIPALAVVGEATHYVLPGTAPGLKGFTHHLQPYLMDVLPKANSGHSPSGSRRGCIHLVVCVHGLQGNQFDLRLYKILLSLALPQARLEFLMASSNQADTFCDFNLMTDRLLQEVLAHVCDMPSPPGKVSFMCHSLGSIIVRSLITRPEFASLRPKLHLYFSICGPHLGTKYQNGIVSVGMWAVRKWYNSKSLLQLSLKDAPDPTDSFLYHLSESPSLECFRHVVLLASPQDKYVPYHSAKIAKASQDAAFQSDLSLHMMQNILEPLRKARVNLVRISVDHSIPASANSFIGRAAHIAMLDNELFIEKLVSLHLVQYFIDN